MSSITAFLQVKSGDAHSASVKPAHLPPDVPTSKEGADTSGTSDGAVRKVGNSTIQNGDLPLDLMGYQR